MIDTTATTCLHRFSFPKKKNNPSKHLIPTSQRVGSAKLAGRRGLEGGLGGVPGVSHRPPAQTGGEALSFLCFLFFFCWFVLFDGSSGLSERRALVRALLPDLGFHFLFCPSLPIGAFHLLHDCCPPALALLGAVTHGSCGLGRVVPTRSPAARSSTLWLKMRREKEKERADVTAALHDGRAQLGGRSPPTSRYNTLGYGQVFSCLRSRVHVTAKAAGTAINRMM